MIVKRTLSPGKVLAHTRGPMAWTLAWALAAPGQPTRAPARRGRRVGPGRVSGQTCAPADYFTRLFVLACAALIPFGLLSLLPDAVWLVLPLATVLAGVFVVMAVVGAANDEPMVGAVTDIPVHAICRDIERDASDALGPKRPPALQPVDGYLW